MKSQKVETQNQYLVISGGKVMFTDIQMSNCIKFAKSHGGAVCASLIQPERVDDDFHDEYEFRRYCVTDENGNTRWFASEAFAMGYAETTTDFSGIQAHVEDIGDPESLPKTVVTTLQPGSK